MVDDEVRSLTNISEARWGDRPTRFRAWEQSIELGRGDQTWAWACSETLRWGVKTRSGFTVDPAQTVSRGDRPMIVARACGVPIIEPVEVVEVITSTNRVGFAYRTLPGHPVSGEEAFVVHRDSESVILTIRSLTRPGDRLLWRAAFPVLLLAQRVARHRYLRALRVQTAR